MASFLAPWMLLGLLAAAVPLVIHLIGRRRARRHPFAALDFLLRSDRRVARRMRLRQLLLLLTRTALLVALALMMAKPFCEVESTLPAVSGQPTSAVLVVDDTLSMGQRLDGETAFERARRRAREMVDVLAGSAEVAVLSVVAPGGPLPRLSGDRRRVRRAIERLRPNLRHASLAPALAEAARILGRASRQQRVIYVFSDLAAHGLPRGAIELPPGIALQPVPVPPARPARAANVALVALSAAGATAPGHRSMRLTARVCNHSTTPARPKLRLTIDGSDVASGVLALAPGACDNKHFNHTFAHSGLHRATAILPADRLPADNRRFLQLEVQSDLRVLLVNGSPATTRHRDELFYLGTALATHAPQRQRIAPRSLTVEELGRARLGAFDVVVLCNVEKLPRQWLAALERFVRGGGGLLVAVGDNVDARAANEQLGRLLPQLLRGPVSTALAGSAGAALRLGRADPDHPVVARLWGGPDGGGLRRARFRRVFRLRPATSGRQRAVLSFDDGSPALVERMVGRGRVALFVSTVDRDWTDMPIRPGFLPLMQQLLRYLGHVPLDRSGAELRVGVPRRVAVPDQARAVRLAAPAGRTRRWDVEQLAGRRSIEIATPAAGFYRLSAVGADGVERPLVRESFAANVDPAESDLRRGKLPAVARRRASGGRATRRVEIWHLLGALALLTLLGESLLVRRG